jgi:transcriptional regulator with XRE-family HTH domain/mannose-6-phosphate isomerase-like protein (cupin superfamily)
MYDEQVNQEHDEPPEDTLVQPLSRNQAGPTAVGSRVREERLRQNIGVRELSRRVGVSASMISQVELGKASPSVGTLYAIVNQLGLSLDELLLDRSNPWSQPGPSATGAEQLASQPAGASPGEHVSQPSVADPVMRRGAGKEIQLASGVRWERLTPQTPQDVDFLFVAYDVDGESCPEDSLMRHSGYEYGHVLKGRLGVVIGFETYELGPGDSISFGSTMPHRLFTVGDEPAEAIWFVVGRRGDPRIVRNLSR